jgi:hypothetical protein
MDRPMTLKGAPCFPKHYASPISSWHGICFLILSLSQRLVSTQQGKEEAIWSSTSHRNNNRHSIKTGSRGLNLP